MKGGEALRPKGKSAVTLKAFEGIIATLGFNCEIKSTLGRGRNVFLILSGGSMRTDLAEDEEQFGEICMSEVGFEVEMRVAVAIGKGGDCFHLSISEVKVEALEVNNRALLHSFKEEAV